MKIPQHLLTSLFNGFSVYSLLVSNFKTLTLNQPAIYWKIRIHSLLFSNNHTGLLQPACHFIFFSRWKTKCVCNLLINNVIGWPVKRRPVPPEVTLFPGNLFFLLHFAKCNSPDMGFYNKLCFNMEFMLFYSETNLFLPRGNLFDRLKIPVCQILILAFTVKLPPILKP